MVQISAEDINRLFSEMNHSSLLGNIEGKQDWLDSNFDESGREYLLGFVMGVLPPSMSYAIEKEGLDVGDAFLAAVSAIFVGGVMLGWQMKAEYATEGTPFDE